MVYCTFQAPRIPGRGGTDALPCGLVVTARVSGVPGATTVPFFTAFYPVTILTPSTREEDALGWRVTWAPAPTWDESPLTEPLVRPTLRGIKPQDDWTPTRSSQP